MSIYIDLSCIEISGEYRCLLYEETTEVRLNTLLELYKHCQANYGRCTGKIYIDEKDGKSKHIGYMFTKREGKQTVEYWISAYKSKKTVYEYL